MNKFLIIHHSWWQCDLVNLIFIFINKYNVVGRAMLFQQSRIICCRPDLTLVDRKINSIPRSSNTHHSNSTSLTNTQHNPFSNRESPKMRYMNLQKLLMLSGQKYSYQGRALEIALSYLIWNLSDFFVVAGVC